MCNNMHALVVSDECQLSANTFDVKYTTDNIKLCPHCDLIVSLPNLQVGQRATCPRCHSLLAIRYYTDPFIVPVVYAVSALIMLALALAFPFITINITGRFNQIFISTIPHALFAEKFAIISWLFIGFVQFIPIFSMLSVILLCLDLNLPKNISRWLARLLFIMKPWCMAEIFLVGVLVSFVKLMAYGEIGLGISFIPYCLFCFLQIKTYQYIDIDMLWQRVAQKPSLDCQPLLGQGGMQQGLRLCHCCHAILPNKQKVCPRCQVKGYIRKPNSIQWTLALLVTSALLYIPANILPIMLTTALGKVIDSTIFSGVMLIWQEGSYPIAIIIFTASIMIPVLKMLALFWLCYSVDNESHRNNQRLQIIYEVVEFVGRWSMIDIFVISVLTALVSMGQFMMVAPAPGSIFFSSVVILTMISANMFDPRLIWDRRHTQSVKKEV